jgi:D-lactate dehydrogenase
MARGMASDVDELRASLGTSLVSTEWPDRLAAAHDASLYRIVPRVVVRPQSPEHVIATFAWCREHQRHCTVRAAATSLSGQAVGSDVILDISRGWRDVDILDNGHRVRCRPGARGGYVNARLREYGRKLGPDPASMQACMVGGIVANNASGMCCGTQHNTYNTLDSIAYILPSGTRINTADVACDALLRDAEPKLYHELITLRDDIRARPSLVNRIQSKYRIKNTMGYSLNAFLDEDQPARIIGRLLVGSEGTLGFIESVTYRTIPEAKRKWTGIILYPTIIDACTAVAHWEQHGAAAIELMDEASLHSIAALPNVPSFLSIPPDQGAAALLVEFHDGEPAINDVNERWTGWATEEHEQARLWALRKGLMPSIGAQRPRGTTMINEDVAVPPDRLADLVLGIQRIFREHGYTQAIIFGHAKDGNMHFVLNHWFATDDDTARYDAFMRSIVHLVVDQLNGSLKAEHGTGRNMAPFVEHEWGTEAYEIMCRVKSIVDPYGILNPGVLISQNPTAHLEHIKPVPSVDAEVDTCIECGFCEHVCPSRDLTLTPRQRIVLRRERDINAENPEVVESIDQAYGYAGLETCATDGMCALACPVGIDTGTLVKRLRHEQHGQLRRTVAGWFADRYALVDRMARLGLRMRTFLGPERTERLTTAMHTMFGALVLSRFAGVPSASVRASNHAETHYVLVPSCVSRWFSASREHPEGLAQKLVELARRAGVHVVIARDSERLCCGQSFESKGYEQAAIAVRAQTANALRAYADSVTVMFDTPTCSAAMHRDGGMPVLDVVQFLHDVVMPNLRVSKVRNHAVVHPGCGVHKSGRVDVLRAIASACAHRVSVPPSSMCCGYAGDRGMRHPELTAAAVAPMVTELDAMSDVDGWYGCNTTCEVGLRTHTPYAWASIVDLLLEAS